MDAHPEQAKLAADTFGRRSGKTTIARLIAQTAGTRFVEINSTSSGVAECKKLFTEAKNELGLTGRKTIIFCEHNSPFHITAFAELSQATRYIVSASLNKMFSLGL